MKKKPFIPVLACAVIFLGICGVLGFHKGWDMDRLCIYGKSTSPLSVPPLSPLFQAPVSARQVR